MQVKICGITETAVAEKLAALGADLMGLICVPSSPRFVSVAQAKSLVAQVKPKVKIVLVFQDQSLAEIKNYTTGIQPDYVQLHGQETPEFCTRVGYPVIKRIHLQKNLQLTLALAAKYGQVAGYLLVDRAEQGTGVLVDLEQVAGLSKKYSILLAGGLTVSNLANVLEKVGQSLAGVDVSSGVEFSPGKKDLKKIKQFITTVRSYDVTH